MVESKEIKYVKDIKSSYIIKRIFLFLNEEQKLNLIIYNKEIQRILGVDIKNYKKKSGKYRIIEKNGKGREYTLIGDKLIFEGEYINGKRIGKGKEYDINGKLIFEGEYINGEWNGMEKEKNMIMMVS